MYPHVKRAVYIHYLRLLLEMARLTISCLNNEKMLLLYGGTAPSRTKLLSHGKLRRKLVSERSVESIASANPFSCGGSCRRGTSVQDSGSPHRSFQWLVTCVGHYFTVRLL